MFGLLPPDLGFAGPVSPFYPNGFSHYIQVRAPATLIGLSSPLTYGVLPFTITDPDLRVTDNGGKVQNALGWDIRFETPAGIKLAHEDVSYDAVTGTKVAWVRLTDFPAGAAVEFRVFYGNGDLSSSEEDPLACWENHLASIEFVGGDDRSGNGANLQLTGVALTTLAGLPAGLFTATSDALITSSGLTLVTSDSKRLIRG